MKKSKFKKLQLSKESISKLAQSKIGGDPAQTCESPCQGGTGCCRAPKPKPCYTNNGGVSCGTICVFNPNFTVTWSSPAAVE